MKMYDKFGRVLRIECTCNDISTFRVELEVNHKDGTSSVQKAPLKKSIYSLYQLFPILKAANYRYLAFITSFDDHSSGRQKLNGISRGEYITIGMQGKNVHQHLPEVTASAMTRIFKRMRLHGLTEKISGSYKYLITAFGKEIITADLTAKNLILVPALTS